MRSKPLHRVAITRPVILKDMGFSGAHSMLWHATGKDSAHADPCLHPSPQLEQPHSCLMRADSLDSAPPGPQTAENDGLLVHFKQS